MKYIGVKEAAKKWNISDRRVRLMCSEGRIEGAIKLEWSWAIPEDTVKPTDGRSTRHMKNRYLRLGFIDLEKALELKEQFPYECIYLKSSLGQNLILNNTLYSLTNEDVKIDKDEILDILNHKINNKLSFDETILLSNINACYENMASLFSDFRENNFKAFLARLFQGTYYESKYDADNEVALQMEVLFSQYEIEWKNLNPIYKAVLVFSELERITPFEKFNKVVSVLVLNGLLISSGYYPLSLNAELDDEINATLTLIKRRGNYQDLALVVERALFKTYSELQYV